MNKSLLLPREKYAEASNRWGRSPIMMEIENDKQTLFYFGANHSRNPDNRQYQVLRDYWNKFLEKTQVKNCIVLVEGGLRKVRENENEAILSGAEGDLVTLFASKVGISIESPELTPEETMNKLTEVTKEEFLLYWFLGWFSGYQRYSDPKPDFDQMVNKWIEFQIKKNLWSGIELSLDNIKKLYKEIVGEDFNLNINSNDLINPNKTGNKINEISRIHSDMRDEYIVSEIKRHWTLGENIFIVFGNGHLIIQEPALKALLK